MVPESWQFKTTFSDLSNLTRWAVEARYPEPISEATISDGTEAVEQARAAWTSVSNSLKEHGFLVEQDL